MPFPATLDLADFACTQSPSRHIDEWRDTATAAEEEEEAAAAAAADVGASAPSVVLQTTGKLLRLYGVVEHRGSFKGAHPCRKQGPVWPAGAAQVAVIGRGWPKLWIA